MVEQVAESEVTAAQKAQVKEIIARMAEAYGVDKKQLRHLLGCKPNVISNWVYYGRIPLPPLMECRVKTGRSMDWLLFGYGPAPFTPATQNVLKQLLRVTLIDAMEFDIIAPLITDAEDKVISRFECKIAAFFKPNETQEVTGDATK